MRKQWIVAGLLCALSGTAKGYKNSEASTADQERVQQGYILSDGLNIHYKSYGEGYPIILVHGWGADTETNWVYSGWVEKLTPFRRVISIDVRGHGKSDKPHQQELYSYAAMSRDVIALMDQLNIERADFFGYSMGAFMGAYLLGHHGERFSSMVLGGIGDETQQSADLSYYIAAALRAGKLVGDFFHVTDPRFDLEALALSCVEMWHDGYPRKLGGAGLMQTSNPVLVINGGQDYPYVQTDQDLVDMIPGARLFRIPGKNHLTAFLDKRFDEAVLGFLAEQAP